MKPKVMHSLTLDKSLISHDKVKAHGIPISPIFGKIELAEINSTIPRIGEVGTHFFWCGKSSVKHTFEVMNQTKELTIGLDLFHELGFGIMGLPTHFLDTIRDIPIIEDKNPPLFLDQPKDLFPKSIITIETPPSEPISRHQCPIPITIHYVVDTLVPK